MLTVKLPDGSVKSYSQHVRPKDVAADIGPGLAKSAVAAVIDGKTVGLDTPLSADGEVQLRILTKKDAAALGVMRHSRVSERLAAKRTLVSPEEVSAR